MVQRRSVIAGGLALAALGRRAEAQPQTRQLAMAPASPGPFRLQEAASFDHQATGVAVSPQGRLFACFPRWTEDSPVSVAEIEPDGALRPFPDEAWNAWRNAAAGKYSARDHFVCAQALLADGLGNLWVLDAGAPGMSGVLPGAPKLVRIELASNTVRQIVGLGEDAALQGSYLNDLRVSPDGRAAFITDSGARGALVVVDLEQGRAHRRLDGHPSTQAENEVVVAVGGRALRRPDGRALHAAADGLALSPDGATLFWQALAGRTLYSAATATLLSDDAADAAATVVKVGTSCVADGLLMSRDGQLYLTSPEDSAIKVWTGEAAETVLADPLLSWPDTLAESSDGTLYVTASRLHEMPWFRPGAAPVLPTTLFRLVRS
ncbi:MAG: L-dopachrome tautomerase-related protein [Reyranellaceae bacterium]